MPHQPDRRQTIRRSAAAATVALSASALVVVSGARAEPEPAAARTGSGWVGTWATAVAVPQTGQALEGWTDTTLRQRIHVSIGGSEARLRLTNVYGTAPLVVRSATLALPGAERGDIDPDTLQPVTFAGSTTVRIPAGAEMLSDPVTLAVPDDGDVIASIYLPGPTGPATYHAVTRTTGWTAPGDRTTAPAVGSFPGRTTSFWFLDGLDVRTDVAGSVAFLGDSITEGGGSTPEADHRWPDFLADRMLAQPRPLRFGILNAGMGGNRLLRDHFKPGQGVSALARLERDVLTQTGVTAVFLHEGVNDILQDPSEYDAEQLIAAYRQVVQRSHDHGLKVVAATITPFQGWSRWTPEREAVRAGVNHWIRTSGEADAVVDFDAVLRDQANPLRLAPEYDSGDHLHPGDEGYRAMADAVDLRLFHR